MADPVEEGWTSMDYCAEMLHNHLQDQSMLRTTLIRPVFRGRAQWLPGPWLRPARFNADRAINRLWEYPRHARQIADQFDWFHICDHSYAQLAHALPSSRVGVYCHDLDAFRCLLDPQTEPRPPWFRAMTRRVLSGLGKATIVFCGTDSIRSQLEATQIVAPDRIVVAPYGVAEEFQPVSGVADDSLPLPFDRATPYLLHVGSTIPRKRIDVLLDAFALAQAQVPRLRLVQVGGVWTSDQLRQIAQLGIAEQLTQLRGLHRDALAALYRNAALVLIPSAAEGFGLPLVEALACGAVVVASDLAVLREVGGGAAIYAPVGDPVCWAAQVVGLLAGAAMPPPREARLAEVARYRWATQAGTIAETYLDCAERASRAPTAATSEGDR